MKTTTIASVFALSTISSIATAADLTIELSGIKEAKGNVRVALYSATNKLEGEPIEALSIPATAGNMNFDIGDLEPGEYAVMLFQDIDKNEELDSNLFGLPKEPWGASLQGSQIFGPPKWDDVKFTLDANGSTIKIEMN